MEFPIARNFSVIYPAPSATSLARSLVSTVYASHFRPTLYTPNFTLLLRTLNFMLHILHSITPKVYSWHSTLYPYTWYSHLNLHGFALYTLHFTFDSTALLFTLDTVRNLGLAPLSCCVCTATCRPERSPLSAILLPTLPKVQVPKVYLLFSPTVCTPHSTPHTLHSNIHSHFTAFAAHKTHLTSLDIT